MKNALIFFKAAALVIVFVLEEGGNEAHPFVWASESKTESLLR